MLTSGVGAYIVKKEKLTMDHISHELKKKTHKLLNQ